MLLTANTPCGVKAVNSDGQVKLRVNLKHLFVL